MIDTWMSAAENDEKGSKHGRRTERHQAEDGTACIALYTVETWLESVTPSPSICRLQSADVTVDDLDLSRRASGADVISQQIGNRWKSGPQSVADVDPDEVLRRS